MPQTAVAWYGWRVTGKRDLEVRPARQSDIDSVAELHVSSWREAYVGILPQPYLDALSVDSRRSMWHRIYLETDWPRQGVLVVSEHSAKTSGFAHLAASRDDDADAGVGEVTAIYLRSEAWGRGVGTALITAAVDTMTRAGYASATLWVLDSNARARRFYERNGWALDSAVKTATIDAVDLLERRYRLAL